MPSTLRFNAFVKRGNDHELSKRDVCVYRQFSRIDGAPENKRGYRCSSVDCLDVSIRACFNPASVLDRTYASVSQTQNKNKKIRTKVLNRALLEASEGGKLKDVENGPKDGAQRRS